MPNDLLVPPAVADKEAEQKGLKSFCLQMAIQYLGTRPGMSNGQTITELAEKFETYMKGSK